MTDKKRIILDCLIVACVCFIWGNSMLSRENSAAISDAVCRAVRTLFGLSPEDPPDAVVSTGFVIRKLAHFSEYCVLSVLICARLGVKKFINKATAVSFAASAIIASTDETIQIFSNRGAAVRDVLIDCTGVLTGIILWLIIVFYNRERQT